MTTTNPKTHAEIEAHRHATLVPAPETVAAADALLVAGLGQPNGTNSDRRLVFSVLDINGNDDACTFWTGDEKTTDPGGLFLTRDEAYAAAARSTADSTAVVYHFGSGDWAVFIDLPRSYRGAS